MEKQAPIISVSATMNDDDWWDTTAAVPDLVDDTIAPIDSTSSTIEEDIETPAHIMPICDGNDEDFTLLLANATNLSRAINDDQVNYEHGSAELAFQRGNPTSRLPPLVTLVKEKKVLANDSVLLNFSEEDFKDLNAFTTCEPTQPFETLSNARESVPTAGAPIEKSRAQQQSTPNMCEHRHVIQPSTRVNRKRPSEQSSAMIKTKRNRLSKKEAQEYARITRQVNQIKWKSSYSRAQNFATDMMERLPVGSKLTEHAYTYFGTNFMEQQKLFQQQDKPFKVTLAFQCTAIDIGGLVSICNPWGDKRKAGCFGRGIYVTEYPESCCRSIGMIFCILPGSKARIGTGDSLSDQYDTGIGNKGLAQSWPLHSMDESLQQDELVLKSESQCLPLAMYAGNLFKAGTLSEMQAFHCDVAVFQKLVDALFNKGDGTTSSS